MLESGQELSARFVLVRRLGAGGSGEVWLAQDRERGCFVAVKILDGRAMPPGGANEVLSREFDRWRALDHPNVLRVDSLYRSAQHVWIAMDYASGGDLSQLRGLAAAEILRAVLPIAGALAYAHDAGIVHRDVKTSNVLFKSDGTPQLADFGLALAHDVAPSSAAGRGSPFSMSRQQASGAPASVADDMYGFGAMLCELFTGYPPSYPDANSEKHPELPASVPPRVAGLVKRLLAPVAEDRPADMREVERELTAALAELPAPTIMSTTNEVPPVKIEPPPLRPPVAQGEPLRGEWRRAAAATHDAEDLRRQGFRRGLGAAAIGLGLVGIAIVFVVLPRLVGEPQPEPVYKQAASKVEPASAPAVEKKEVDFAALAKAKQEADDERASVADRLQKITARAAEQWGGEDFRRANDELAAGDKDYEAREYASAKQHFAALDPLLDSMEKRAGTVLAEQLKAGAKALDEGRSADARAAFELAGKIDVGNKVAAQGLKRAGTLDQVLALLATGEQSEKQSNMAGALENFRKVLALDPEMTRARDGMARIESRLAGDAFASSMARGYSALAAADYSKAREAFEAARKIRPDAPEIQQALRQIEQEQRTRVISAKLEKAQELEQQEKWAEALKEYRAVLELDSTIAGGNEGVARTSPRASLDEQLELYLTQPERLFSQPVRAAARETLARATAVSQPGPVLQRQIATLNQWLVRADKPVPVAIQSDNVTQVTIYRVGALGAFDRRSLELVPGSYTVVGTRPGYRDVRREIQVTPGATLEPVVIRCEDRI
jgi:Protein kinase domain